jgi:hypothetical protein
VRGRRRAPGAAGQERADRRRDHRLEIAARELGAAAAQAPEIELVGLARVQTIDAVAPVDDAGAGEQDVAPAALAGELGERGGHDGRGLRSQHDVAGDVARVADVADDALGRVAEAVVVVGDGRERRGAAHAWLGAPVGDEGGGRSLDERLQGVRPVVRIGQIGNRKRAA